MAKQIKLVLIDAHALIHRAYHALPPMSTKDGQPTNAVYGFTTMLLKVLTTLKPTHIVACFDMKGPTFRHKEFKEYKAHRKEADQELKDQFDVVREVVRAFDISIVEKKGFEADDIIGTITAQNPKVKKIIVTGDMDALQLVDDKTFVLTLKRGITDTVLYDTAAVREKYGFEPERLIDFKGLRGDPSDNIPGVSGVGEKTALDLVQKYGEIEQVYQHLEELSTRAKGRLEGHKKEALMSRRLATIDRSVPVKFVLEEAKIGEYDKERLAKVFERLEFKTLLERLPKAAKTTVQPTLFEKVQEGNDQVKIEMPDNYRLVQSESDKEELKKWLNNQQVIAFDTETDGLGARTSPIVGMSFAGRSNTDKSEQGKLGVVAWYVPVNSESVGEWKELLENEKIQKTGHNLKYDYQVLRQSGIKLGGIVFDSMLASYLLKPGARQHGLSFLATQELGHNIIPISDLIGEGKNQGLMSQAPINAVARYACEDAEIAWLLYEKLRIKIDSEGLQRVLDELEVPLLIVLAKMELAGVKIAEQKLGRIEEEVTARIQQLQSGIWEQVGEKFNINSTVQLRVILFEKLKLPTVGIKRTQSGYSTAASELYKLRGQHGVIELLEEYRELTKLLNTYIEPLPELIDKKSGRIHTSFNQTITATGRLSSNNPNLQNIPARTSLGQKIREVFVAEKGNKLVKADYSQIELRLVAHISQDEKMLTAFRNGEDIHRATAAWVYEVVPEEITSEQRRAAKTLNFGVLYGMGPQKFAREAKVSIEEARSFIERYRKNYQGIAELIEQTVAQAEELGYVETLLGRKRYVPEINSRAPAVRAAAERAAFNFPIQGTAADVLKKAMINLDSYIGVNYPTAKMVLTVHDELVCEVTEEKAGKLALDMKSVMESVVTLDVPLIVDVGIGQNWKDIKAVLG